MKDPVCLIKCTKCKRQFPSPIGFGSAKAFYSSSLVGNTVQCRECGAMVSCNKENMYFNPGDGTIHHGEDTISA